ncbi:hypothetical protein ATT74_22725 [Salmonella enterica subsp. enterica serovar Panama]|uniref:Uncharacterized protein n=1 Tax=Salmonella enterica subsp. enterica serovar Panama TaxID=29472 RepID=A0A619AL16_SALET|nr:hypothetical protein [Salmonella enterica subsp. enterica serovar Amager]EBW4032751.1 hypothetical protein [Salmonella enterica subsp. enterica serovar Newport]ECT5252444.1 hypothetical protein [Salmonella enterica subsp. enterica serovar Panama]HAF4710535.1 hypothetical protein [Salmonella enterica]EBV5220531.1 hypothetical protein [Salmonella enterica subsp. enterica serovar Amager]
MARLCGILTKGRVGRAHLTLEDRMVKELRLKGISTIDAANAFAEVMQRSALPAENNDSNKTCGIKNTARFKLFDTKLVNLETVWAI